MGNGYSVKLINHIFLCLVLSLFVLLNGCSTVRKDGPPPFDVDVSKIPNAKPQAEPRAKYGNMASYRVHGQKYHVLKTAKNYEERGIASWYGMKFHHLRTSSGEIYNLLGMTAAHKSLPLPTYVQVTNLENGKKIIVKVNDRGPFASDRIIDLSFVAAKKLGMLGRGTAYVDVKAIDPNEAVQSPLLTAQNKSKTPGYRKSHLDGNEVYLQVGAFKNKLYAEKLKRRLTPIVSSPIEITHVAHSTSRLYHVKIGPIHDLATATHIKKKLQAMGVKMHHVRV